MTDRLISSCSHTWSGSNCKKCGVYLHPSDPVMKTNYYDSYLNCSSVKYLKHMRKRQCKQIYNRQISEGTFNLLESICEKFQYSIETLALGVYLYAKTSQKNNKDEKFWASAALIVASKGIELDKRVPYLNRYQRYADKSFSQEQYQEAQRTIFQDLEFDVQHTTFISFLHFYMTNGVLFKSDSFNHAILKYIEDDMISKARDYIKTGQFLSHEPEKLALSIVKEIRVKFRLDPWKKQIQLISGFSQSQIPSAQSPHQTLKPMTQSNQKPKQKQKQLFSQTLRVHQRQPLSLNPLSINFLQNSLNLTDEKAKPKKLLESTLKFQNVSMNNMNANMHMNIKENSSKILQDIPLPLATLRNQVTSSSSGHGQGHALNGSKYAIGDRLATVSSFVTSRRF